MISRAISFHRKTTAVSEASFLSVSFLSPFFLSLVSTLFLSFSLFAPSSAFAINEFRTEVGERVQVIEERPVRATECVPAPDCPGAAAIGVTYRQRGYHYLVVTTFAMNGRRSRIEREDIMNGTYREETVMIQKDRRFEGARDKDGNLDLKANLASCRSWRVLQGF
jgi:hypothetical protein